MFFHITIAHKIPLTRRRVLQLQYIHVSKTTACTNIHVILTIRKSFIWAMSFHVTISDWQNNGRVGNRHQHEDKRMGCHTGGNTTWVFFFFVLPVQSIKYISQSSDVSSCSSKFQMSLMMLPHLHWDIVPLSLETSQSRSEARRKSIHI